MLKDKVHTYIFLLRPDNGSDAFRADFQKQISESYEYQNHLKGRPFSVHHFSGIKSMFWIHNFTLPALRYFSDMKNDVFIFVFDDRRRLDYAKYIVKNSTLRESGLTNEQMLYRAPNGFADIDKGAAFAKIESFRTVLHEWMHLASCGTWHDDHGNDLPCDCIIKREGHKQLPWCDGSMDRLWQGRH